MNRKMKKALKSAFDAPQPINKEKFLNNLPYPKATSYEFFIAQLGYIRKRFWSLSILLLLAMTLFCSHLNENKEVVGLISAMLPLLTLIVIAEVRKSGSFNMTELEASCKFNFSKITLIRLSIIGIFHFVLLVGALLILKEKSQYGLVRYALYSVTPFLLSSYLSFWITNHLKTKDTMYVCSGVTFFISISVFILNLNYTVLYSPDYTMVWAVIFTAIFILLVKELYFLMKERIGQWNFA